jgi:multidrug efflux pump subunit AcrA (membrane-fusion protein)
MRGLRSSASAGLACLGIALAGCSHAAPPKQQTAPTVATTVARPGVIHPSVSLAGIIAPFQNVAIQSTLSEPTDSVNVKEGDRVSNGEVLAKLDTADLQAQLAADLAQAQSAAANTTHTAIGGTLSIAQGDETVQNSVATVRQAQQTLAKDTLDLRRYQALASKGFIADQTLSQQLALVRNDEQAVNSAQATLASSQAAVSANGTLDQNGGGSGLQASSVEQARATEQVDLAQAQQVRTSIAKAAIVSPIDGVVVNRNLNVGEYPGTRQLFTLQQTDPIYAILRGSGSQIAHITENAPATIVASDLGGRHISGSVGGVLNEINPGSTDFVVKIVLRNPSGQLRPGMAVAGDIALPAVTGTRVPVTAFTDDGHGSVMVVASDGTVKTQNVTENGDDGKTAIVSGLAQGTRVITDGQSGVGNGEKVAFAK